MHTLSKTKITNLKSTSNLINISGFRSSVVINISNMIIYNYLCIHTLFSLCMFSFSFFCYFSATIKKGVKYFSSDAHIEYLPERIREYTLKSTIESSEAVTINWIVKGLRIPLSFLLQGKRKNDDSLDSVNLNNSKKEKKTKPNKKKRRNKQRDSTINKEEFMFFILLLLLLLQRNECYAFKRCAFDSMWIKCFLFALLYRIVW